MSLEQRIEEKVKEFDAEFNKAAEFLVTKFLPAETTVNVVHKVKDHYKQALTSIAEEGVKEGEKIKRKRMSELTKKNKSLRKALSKKDLELKTIAEEAREEERNKNAGKVNGTPCFEWMDSWLHSFEVQNQDKYRNLKKDFKEWLRKQPMSC